MLTATTGGFRKGIPPRIRPPERAEQVFHAGARREIHVDLTRAGNVTIRGEEERAYSHRRDAGKEKSVRGRPLSQPPQVTLPRWQVVRWPVGATPSTVSPRAGGGGADQVLPDLFGTRRARLSRKSESSWWSRVVDPRTQV